MYKYFDLKHKIGGRAYSRSQYLSKHKNCGTQFRNIWFYCLIQNIVSAIIKSLEEIGKYL